MSLCDTLKRLSLDTWDKLEASRGAKFQLKEETITDLNILALKTKHSREVSTTVFTKKQESRVGADWEWWFRSAANRWIGLRIQAKIINLRDDAFHHLHYRTSQSSYQSDTLIAHALCSQHPTIPLYCFYLHTYNNAYLAAWHCGTLPSLKHLYGCSLASAWAVQKLRRPLRNHLADVQDFLRPWHCMACCTNYGPGDLAINIDQYARAHFGLNELSQLDLSSGFRDSFVTDSAPPHVRAIFENEMQEIEPPDEDIRGVVIFDEGAAINR